VKLTIEMKQALYRIREEELLPKVEAAKKLGVAPYTYRNLENVNFNGAIRDHTYVKIAEYLAKYYVQKK